jgi:hypothetical protein
MAILWQYYLAIAVAMAVLVASWIAQAPLLLVIVAAIWFYYATLRCPLCKALIKTNRRNWWRFPERTCLKCGRDLTKP